jgi:hypothetical protein
VTEVPWIEAATIGSESAHETWALAATQVLEQVASGYHAVVTIKELGEAIQQRSRIRTRQPAGQWLGDVLFRVTSGCFERRQSNLSALCVTDLGTMPDWYADTVLVLRGSAPVDVDKHAAGERLDCYRDFAADLPADGGVAALPPRPERPARVSPPRSSGVRVSREPRISTPRKPAASDVVYKICPTCFMALPGNGICDNCD